MLYIKSDTNRLHSFTAYFCFNLLLHEREGVVGKIETYAFYAFAAVGWLVIIILLWLIKCKDI